MRKRDGRTAAPTLAPPPDTYRNRVTVGSNKGRRAVALIFGDPLAEPPNFIELDPAAARGLAQAMLEHADKAEGKRPS